MGNYPNSPINTGPALPVGPSGPSGVPMTPALQQQQAQLGIQNQLSSQFGLGDIFSLGGDVWGWIKDHAGNLVPRDANGNIDWGKIGGSVKDLAGWLSAHKSDIIDGLNVVNQYQRSQKSDEYAKKAVDAMQQTYDAKAPLRVAGQAGMLNPQPNDLSGLKTQGQNGLSIRAPLPVAPSSTNLNAAQNIAGPMSGNPFAKAASPLPPLPVSGGQGAPNVPSGPTMPGMPPVQTMPQRPFTPQAPTPLPVASQPARFLQNGLETGANGAPVQGGYNALADTYRQLGTTPGVVNDRIKAVIAQNPAMVNALPVDQRDALQRTLAATGA